MGGAGLVGQNAGRGLRSGLVRFRRLCVGMYLSARL